MLKKDPERTHVKNLLQYEMPQKYGVEFFYGISVGKLCLFIFYENILKCLEESALGIEKIEGAKAVYNFYKELQYCGKSEYPDDWWDKDAEDPGCQIQNHQAAIKELLWYGLSQKSLDEDIDHSLHFSLMTQIEREYLLPYKNDICFLMNHLDTLKKSVMMSMTK
ncbi:hypothetical protein FACS1894109_12300 [Spirochaetia bacterium]|nr:hypothetical protein FACS1894109_12300 [Spirochaetia bacterium]